MKKGKDVQQIPLSGAAEEEILSRLSERVERAVESIQRLRKERDELRNRLADAEGKLRAVESDSSQLSAIQSENERHRDQRDEIRNRIERILGTLERLEEESEEEAG